MIVADANLIAALTLPVHENSEVADQILLTDRDWAAPALWKSEFCNILATAVRNGYLKLELALGLAQEYLQHFASQLGRIFGLPSIAESST